MISIILISQACSEDKSNKMVVECTDKLSTEIIMQPQWVTETKQRLDGRKDLNYYLETKEENYSLNSEGEKYDYKSEEFSNDEALFLTNLLEKVNQSIILNFNQKQRLEADFLITKTCIANESTYGIVQMSWDGSEYIMALNGCNSMFEDKPEEAILHELGHVIGLEHPFDDSDGDCYQSTDSFSNNAATMSQTLMAYKGAEHTPKFYTELDLKAISEIYGKNSTN